MKVWPVIERVLEAHGTCALVSVIETQGSSPRETGARMIVTPEGFHGTIGGGTLEWKALAAAQSLLGKPRETDFLGHAGLAGIEQMQGVLHRLADSPGGRRGHIGPVFPGGVDGAGEVGGGHGQLVQGFRWPPD